MDNYTIAALVSVIGQVGFPAALVLFLLVKGSNTLGKLTEAINRQTTALAVLYSPAIKIRDTLRSLFRNASSAPPCVHSGTLRRHFLALRNKSSQSIADFNRWGVLNARLRPLMIGGEAIDEFDGA